MPFLRRLPPLFHLGLFPLVCLLWLGADSMHQVMRWDRVASWESMQLESAAAAIRFKDHRVTDVSADERASARPAGNRFDRFPISYHDEYGKILPPVFSLPEARENWDALGQTGRYVITRKVTLPYWLMVLGYLPLWLLPVGWQVRRRKRKFEG